MWLSKILLLLYFIISSCDCYISVDNPILNWSDAETYCLTQFDSDLATITSNTQDNDAYNTEPIHKHRWIGINDLNSASYTWIDGTNVIYTNWASWEPNNGPDEDCGMLVGPNPGFHDDFRWHDIYCETERQFICNDMTTSCLEQNYTDTFIWDELLSQNISSPPYIDLSIFEIDTSDLTLNIEVGLSYLQSTSSEIGDGGYGATYWLDFQSFNGNNMHKIYQPGLCGNRLESSYYNNQTLRSFDEWWMFSERPYNDDQLGSDAYLTYPDPGNTWNIYGGSGDFETKCSRIKYNALFSWSDLFGCDGIGNTIQIIEDDTFINLTGIFYVDVISPLDKTYDTGYYRVYELLSQPFAISLQKTTQILASIGINLFDIYLFSIFSENENGNFVINVITESAEYIHLDQATIIRYPAPLLNAKSIHCPSDSITTSCITGINNICRQIFQVNVEFGDNYCIVNNKTNFDLSGSYTFSFNINCENSSNCNDYVNEYGLTSILSFDVSSYIDETCNVLRPRNVSSYTAEMRFYSNPYYQNYTNESILYDYGDVSYVEIETNLPQHLFQFVSLSLVNVWICQYDADLGDLPDPQRFVFNGGCLANSTYDFNLYYHIYPTLLFNAMLSQENITNIVRFSFKIPDIQHENRDKLFIHAEVEISLLSNTNSTKSRRRTLLSILKNTMFVQIGSDIMIKSSEIQSNQDDENNDDQLDKNHDTFIIMGAVIAVLLLLIFALLWLVMFYKRKTFYNNKNKEQTEKSKDINIEMQTNDFVE